jgi:hypothetical protein
MTVLKIEHGEHVWRSKLALSDSSNQAFSERTRFEYSLNVSPDHCRRNHDHKIFALNKYFFCAGFAGVEVGGVRECAVIRSANHHFDFCFTQRFIPYSFAN